MSTISNREVPLRSVESVLLLPNHTVPSEREKLGNYYRLQGSVEKREAVLSTAMTAAVDDRLMENGYRLQGSVEKREAVLLTELSVAVDHG